MSLWWVQKNQLDQHQIELIEKLPLRESFLILGPPGSGKTNVLLRAQFVRGQEMPNVLLMTFTRPLTEFVKTGCFDDQGRQIFPLNCVTTLESWQRNLYAQHGEDLPTIKNPGNLIEWKTQLATGALDFRRRNRLPRYDSLFIDEAQDLLPEEVELLKQWSPVLFFVGDDRQRIYETDGLRAVRNIIPNSHERLLPFHYRVAPEICRMADRILLPHGGKPLASTSHYKGPLPAEITIQPRRLSKKRQLEQLAGRLKEQVRVYADLIKQGDRLGVIVARKDDREVVFDFLEGDEALRGKSKIIRARGEGETDYDSSFDPDTPICILTVQGCKGLEFRAVHWLFCDELQNYHSAEHYYTVVTRAKTSLDIYFTKTLPQILARAHSPSGVTPW